MATLGAEAIDKQALPRFPAHPDSEGVRLIRRLAERAPRVE